MYKTKLIIGTLTLLLTVADNNITVAQSTTVHAQPTHGATAPTHATEVVEKDKVNSPTAAHQVPVSETTTHSGTTAYDAANAHSEGSPSGNASHHSKLMKIESEFYAGGKGYRFGGISLTKPIGERMALTLGARLVKESLNSPTFPSVSAKLGMEVSKGLELEPFFFGYLPKAEQWAVGVGLRVEKDLFDFNLLGRTARVKALVSPVYTNVKAMEAQAHDPSPVTHGTAHATLSAIENPVRLNAAVIEEPVIKPAPHFAKVNQFMILGGAKIERYPFTVSFFGNQSYFSRDTAHLETPLDVEEMTHFTAHKNNSGFAKNSVGTEISYSPLKSLAFTGGYAKIRFNGLPRRDSFFLRPSYTFSKEDKEIEIFGGFQILRGGHAENNLGTIGMAFHF